MQKLLIENILGKLLKEHSIKVVFDNEPNIVCLFESTCYKALHDIRNILLKKRGSARDCQAQIQDIMLVFESLESYSDQQKGFFDVPITIKNEQRIFSIPLDSNDD